MAQSSKNVNTSVTTVYKQITIHASLGWKMLPSVTIHLKNADPDDIQFFIDDLPATVKGKTG